MPRFFLFALIIIAGISLVPKAQAANSCSSLPSYDDLKKALSDARHQDNGGLNNDMWGAIVDRSGAICAIAYTGASLGDQWPGSRGIAIEKANTANGLSLPHFALSTANLYAGVQPGGSLYGLLQTDPVDTQALHAGPPEKLGTKEDPAIGKHLGGVVIFGGGLALYNQQGTLLGALGVSGDTSCADHNIAWKTRHALNDDYVPAGVTLEKNDQIIYDVDVSGKSASGWGHPACPGKESEIAKTLPPTQSAKK